MSKKPRAGRSKNAPSSKVCGTPPLLSDKLIAQLQGAVNAAQRERLSQVTFPGSAARPPQTGS
jgi:hypothetical protein